MLFVKVKVKVMVRIRAVYSSGISMVRHVLGAHQSDDSYVTFLGKCPLLAHFLGVWVFGHGHYF